MSQPTTTGTSYPSWAELSEVDRQAIIYSDAHKAAFGRRPDAPVIPATVEAYTAAIEKLKGVIRANEERDPSRVGLLGV